jgi:hypothetical protein
MRWLATNGMPAGDVTVLSGHVEAASYLKCNYSVAIGAPYRSALAPEPAGQV